ncbi:MAG: hypothetical protein HYZ89_00290 [Candidatus Omnitrophica bacterium]|nr:hypothetical protein [Candidatus Omnitrophota bacterium]
MINFASRNLLKGQATLEYAVVIAVAVAALLAMQIYMKRGVQGKLREATDQVGEQFSPTAYHGKFKRVQTSATEETLHVATQGAGESKSETTTIGNLTGIKNTRDGQDIGQGVQEQLTDAQSIEKCLFPPCP